MSAKSAASKLGHSSHQTTELYADFASDPSQGARWAEAAFGAGIETGIELSASESNSEQEKRQQ